MYWHIHEHQHRHKLVIGETCHAGGDNINNQPFLTCNSPLTILTIFGYLAMSSIIVNWSFIYLGWQTIKLSANFFITHKWHELHKDEAGCKVVGNFVGNKNSYPSILVPNPKKVYLESLITKTSVHCIVNEMFDLNHLLIIVGNSEVLDGVGYMLLPHHYLIYLSLSC